MNPKLQQLGRFGLRALRIAASSRCIGTLSGASTAPVFTATVGTELNATADGQALPGISGPP